jgi:hypothetical protein
MAELGEWQKAASPKTAEWKILCKVSNRSLHTGESCEVETCARCTSTAARADQSKMSPSLGRNFACYNLSFGVVC